MRQIQNHPDYFISEDGQIFSMKNGAMKQLKLKLESYGYYRIGLDNRSYLVHRLVAKTYIENPENLGYINHRNGIKTDNNVSNLEWITAGDNQKHAYNTGLKNIPRGVLNGRSILSEQDVIEIYKRLLENERVSDVAKDFDIHTSTVSDIKFKRHWSHILEKFPDMVAHPKSEKLSGKTVEWICLKLQEGYSCKEILEKSTNENITIDQISDIKRRKCHSRLSKNYVW